MTPKKIEHKSEVYRCLQVGKYFGYIVIIFGFAVMACIFENPIVGGLISFSGFCICVIVRIFRKNSS